MKEDSEQQGQCIRVSCGKREAIIWINPETMEYRVVHCNWFDKCIRCGVLLGGHCPGYCDLVSSAKHYIRGRRRRNVQTDLLSPSECAIIKSYNPGELTGGLNYGELDFDDLDDFDEFGDEFGDNFRYI